MSSLGFRKLLLGLLLVGTCCAIVYAIYANKPWHVPDWAKQLKNPVPNSPETIAAARPVYHDKCANCHGESGKGDGPDAASYYPTPTNLTDARHAASLSDGEIFYQISQGRKPMPSFRKRLTEEQRWQLVRLVRSFSSPENATRAK